MNNLWKCLCWSKGEQLTATEVNIKAVELLQSLRKPMEGLQRQRANFFARKKINSARSDETGLHQVVDIL